MILRPYQEQAVAAVIEHLRGKPVLVAPTGSGKTFMGVHVVKALNRPTLWLAHRRELVQQAAGQLTALGVRCGILQAGFQEKRWLPVQVASVQTLARRTLPPAELVVVDEAHHAVGPSYRQLLDQYPHADVLGLTATPFRLDGRGLGEVFSTLVVAATTKQLCEDGTLVAPVVFAPPVPTMQGVKITAGDYNLKQVAERMDKAKLVGDIVETWRKHAGGAARRTVVFTINVAHSQHITERFRAAGVAAEHLDGTVPALARAAILRRLRMGETTVLCNCMVLTEGWDLPALEVAVIARPTASLNLHLQMLGRIMRAAEGKAGALVLDHAGNHGRHGGVTEEIEYSLDGTVRAKRKPGDGEERTKTCPQCYLVCPAGCHACPECGFEFASEAVIPHEAPGELVPFGVRSALWDQWEAQRLRCGFREGYALARYKDRFGEFPLVHNGKLVNEVTDEVRAAQLKRLAAVAKMKGYKPGWALHVYHQKFGHWPTRAMKLAAGL